MSASTAETGGTVGPMPKRSHHMPLSKVTKLQDAFDHPQFFDRIKQATPKHLSPDRMLAVFVQSVQKTPKLAKCNMMSLLGAFLSVASVGLEPNTALQHAYLIPFDKRGKNPDTGKWEVIRTDVQVIFGYQGLLELAYRSGLLRSVHADVVWDTDEFDFWYGSGANLRHKPLGGTRKTGVLPTWAYMHANLKGDSEMFEVMPISDVLAVRDSTQAYQQAIRAHDEANKKGWAPPATYTEAPWVKHFVPMAKKTVFRAGSKWLPKSIELAAAIQLDEMQERTDPNYGAVIEGSANILDGGLDALTDEYTGRVETDIGSAFSMQDNRQPAMAERQDPPAAQQQQRKAAPVQQTQTATQQPTGFSAYLIDQWGEMVGDTEHTTAMSFANALSDLARRTNPENLQGLFEANADAIAEAGAANSVARSIIDGLLKMARSETQQQADPGPQAMQPVVLTENGRGAAWPPYAKAIKDSLMSVGADALDEWVTLNLPTIKRAPDQHRLVIVKHIGDHCGMLSIPVPAVVSALITRPAAAAAAPAAAPAATTTTTAQDPDERWVEATIAEVAKATSHEEVLALAQNSGVRTRLHRYRQERAELFERVDAAFAAALQAFGPPTDNEPPPADPDDPGII